MKRIVVLLFCLLTTAAFAQNKGGNGVSAIDPYLRQNQAVNGNLGFLESYDYSGRTQVFPSLVGGQHTTILIIFGDSLASSTDNSAYIITNAGKVQDISLDNGGIYNSVSPALSCSTETPPNLPSVSGYWGHRLADKLITNGKTARVIVACIGIGSTGTSFWDTIQFSWRFNCIFARLNSLGLLSANRIFVMSSIGGLDQTLAIPAVTVQANLNTIISSIRSAGFSTTPIYLALSSWGGGGTGGANGTAVRTGITNAIAGNANVFTGADTDTIPLGDRYDTNHYNSTGSDAAATLWYNVIQGIFP